MSALATETAQYITRQPGDEVFAINVARVREVLELPQITPPPRIAMRWRTELIQGLGHRGGEFVIILDINTVFSSSDAVLARHAAAALTKAGVSQY
jgi:chemotaxis signal transduction protein